jgi:hypothetical protein
MEATVASLRQAYGGAYNKAGSLQALLLKGEMIYGEYK